MNKIYNSKDEYYESHRICPECKAKDSTSQTYEGFIFYEGKPFKDENEANCECGWIGIVDDLI